MSFTDENGEPRLIIHKCDHTRKRQVMSQTDLQMFGIDLLVELYENQGMSIKNINRIEGYEYPQFVMESKNGKIYYVAVKATTYPNDPFLLPKDDCCQIIEVAKRANATPVFAGISFVNALNFKWLPECGGAFLIVYKGLQQL